MNTDIWRVLGYQPHHGQAEFHDAPQRFKMLIAGARFGKSLATAREVLRDLACSNLRGWLVAPMYSLGRPEFRYLAESLGHLHQVEKLRFGGVTGNSRLRTIAGGQVAVMSAGVPEGLLGQELDWIVVCEAAHLNPDILQRYLRPRLTTRRGRLVVGTTPRGSNWVHELYMRAQDTHDWACLRFATWDNPMVAPEEIEAARAILPPEVFEEQYGGEFRARSGRVFPEFTRETHVRKVPLIPGAAVFRGLDFGFTNPTACLWVMFDQHSRMNVVREHYLKGQTMSDLALSIREVDDELVSAGLRIGTGWADPSGASHIATLAQYGVPFQGAHNGMQGGLDMVRMHLRQVIETLPGLIVDPRCTNLVAEFESYQWADNPKPGERKPAKGQDHALDALRYVVAGLQRQVGWKPGARVC